MKELFIDQLFHVAAVQASLCAGLVEQPCTLWDKYRCMDSDQAHWDDIDPYAVDGGEYYMMLGLEGTEPGENWVFLPSMVNKVFSIEGEAWTVLYTEERGYKLENVLDVIIFTDNQKDEEEAPAITEWDDHQDLEYFN